MFGKSQKHALDPPPIAKSNSQATEVLRVWAAPVARRQAAGKDAWCWTSRTMRVLNHANLSPDEVADIAVELSSQENLKHVMAWAMSQSPGTFIPGVVAGVVVQDEFTHDVIVPWRDGLVLVYDTT